jgi:hypothetical protein
MREHTKEISLSLVGLDGNDVLTKAKSGDYDNLVATLASHCENPMGGDDSDEEEEDDDL